MLVLFDLVVVLDGFWVCEVVDVMLVFFDYLDFVEVWVEKVIGVWVDVDFLVFDVEFDEYFVVLFNGWYGWCISLLVMVCYWSELVCDIVLLLVGMVIMLVWVVCVLLVYVSD